MRPSRLKIILFASLLAVAIVLILLSWGVHQKNNRRTRDLFAQHQELLARQGADALEAYLESIRLRLDLLAPSVAAYLRHPDREHFLALSETFRKTQPSRAPLVHLSFIAPGGEPLFALPDPAPQLEPPSSPFTLSYPLKDERGLLGTFKLTLDRHHIEENILLPLKPQGEGLVLLASKEGKILSLPKFPALEERVGAAFWTAFEQTLADRMGAPTGTFTYSWRSPYDPSRLLDKIAAYRTIRTFDQNWRLLVDDSFAHLAQVNWEEYRDYRHLLIFVALSTVIGAVLLVRFYASLVTTREQDRAKARFQTLFNSARDALFSCDTRGQITEVNPEMERISGLERRALVGRDLGDLFGPASRERARRIAERVVNGESIRGEILELIPPDEDPVPLEINAFPRVDQRRIVGMDGIARDITARLERERMTRYLQAYYEAILHQLNLGIAVMNPELQLEFANAYLKENFKATAGKTCFSVLFSRESPCEQCPVLRCLETGRIQHGLQKRVGARIYNVTVLPLNKPEGKTSYVAIYQDVTESLELEQTRNEFLSMLTHDIKAPLTGVLGHAALIAEYAAEASEPEVILPSTRAIEDAGQRILNIIGDFLTLSKMESGALALRREPLLPSELLARVSRQFFATARSKGVALVTKCSANLPAIEGDPALLERLLTNLVENALKFTQEGQVRLKADLDEGTGKLRVLVEDTGPGIEPEQLKRIFDKYQQAGSSRAAQGVGLGLHICKLISDLHGGTVEAANRSEGGAAFLLTLPLSTPSTVEGRSRT